MHGLEHGGQHGIVPLACSLESEVDPLASVMMLTMLLWICWSLEWRNRAVSIVDKPRQ